MKKLPIGISTLANMFEDDYVYIDKTHHVHKLVDTGGKYFFLSRPRRFGKSLFLDTLKQAFLANKRLFKGLFLEKNWDWKTTYPIIHLSFAGGSAYESKKNLLAVIDDHIKKHAKQYGVTISNPTKSTRFNELIVKIADKTSQKVVLLIDEYDKPILDVINSPEEAKENREILKGLYSVIKDQDTRLKFVFLTGVSKFSKVSLFSGLNNLNDISTDPLFADVCGYTQTEMETAFGAYLTHGNVDRDTLKQWYNGYNFGGQDNQKVYNPFDILLFCFKGYQYRNYWFETATPTFLVKLIQQKPMYLPSLESLSISESELSSFDVDNMPTTTLLFQTGYLTIKAISKIGNRFAYIMTYPNLEVKASLNESLLALGSSSETSNSSMVKVDQIINNNGFDDLKTLFNAHFASISHQWYTNNPMGQYGGFYAGIVYSCFAALGYDLKAEDATSTGRINLTLETPDKILVLEFKLAKYGSAEEALQQIINKNYVDKFQADKRSIYLIGISFDEVKKEVCGVKWQKLASSH